MSSAIDAHLLEDCYRAIGSNWERNYDVQVSQNPETLDTVIEVSWDEGRVQANKDSKFSSKSDNNLSDKPPDWVSSVMLRKNGEKSSVLDAYEKKRFRQIGILPYNVGTSVSKPKVSWSPPSPVDSKTVKSSMTHPYLGQTISFLVDPDVAGSSGIRYLEIREANTGRILRKRDLKSDKISTVHMTNEFGKPEFHPLKPEFLFIAEGEMDLIEEYGEVAIMGLSNGKVERDKELIRTLMKKKVDDASSTLIKILEEISQSSTVSKVLSEIDRVFASSEDKKAASGTNPLILQSLKACGTMEYGLAKKLMVLAKRIEGYLNDTERILHQRRRIDADFGERLMAIKNPVLCVYNYETDKLHKLESLSCNRNLYDAHVDSLSGSSSGYENNGWHLINAPVHNVDTNQKEENLFACFPSFSACLKGDAKDIANAIVDGADNVPMPDVEAVATQTPKDEDTEIESSVVFSCYDIRDFPTGLCYCLNRDTTDYFIKWSYEEETGRGRTPSSEKGMAIITSCLRFIEQKNLMRKDLIDNALKETIKSFLLPFCGNQERAIKDSTVRGILEQLPVSKSTEMKHSPWTLLLSPKFDLHKLRRFIKDPLVYYRQWRESTTDNLPTQFAFHLHQNFCGNNCIFAGKQSPFIGHCTELQLYTGWLSDRKLLSGRGINDVTLMCDQENDPINLHGYHVHFTKFDFWNEKTIIFETLVGAVNKTFKYDRHTRNVTAFELSKSGSSFSEKSLHVLATGDLSEISHFVLASLPYVAVSIREAHDVPSELWLTFSETKDRMVLRSPFTNVKNWKDGARLSHICGGSTGAAKASLIKDTLVWDFSIFGFLEGSLILPDIMTSLRSGLYHLGGNMCDAPVPDGVERFYNFFESRFRKLIAEKRKRTIPLSWRSEFDDVNKVVYDCVVIQKFLQFYSLLRQIRMAINKKVLYLILLDIYNESGLNKETSSSGDSLGEESWARFVSQLASKKSPFRKVEKEKSDDEPQCREEIILQSGLKLVEQQLSPVHSSEFVMSFQLHADEIAKSTKAYAQEEADSLESLDTLKKREPGNPIWSLCDHLQEEREVLYVWVANAKKRIGKKVGQKEDYDFSLKELITVMNTDTFYEDILQDDDVKGVGCPISSLVLGIHGGPHGVTIPMFNPQNVILPNVLNSAIFFPNYRGSCSFDEEYCHTLQGNIGEMDCHDCEQWSNFILKSLGSGKRNAIKPNESDIPVFVSGGSHGGYLTAHLIARNKIPNIKGGIMRNPVTDLEAMLKQTDIPDWIFAEGNNRRCFSWPKLTKEESLELQRRSPVTYIDNVKCDVLMLLGDSDRRVPMGPNGEAYVNILRRKKPELKVLCEIYAGEQHGFDKEPTVAKANLITLEFIRKRIME